MNIGIIGAGNVGGKLGKVWAANGHTIIYGVRNPLAPNVQTILEETDHKASAAKIKEAAERSEVVVLATPWEAIGEVVFQIVDLKGKILIDCVNPIKQNPDWPLAQGRSASEEIALRLPGFKVVKAFNTIGAGNLNNVTFESRQADAFICGDDIQSKQVVAQLAKEIGFNTIDAGGLQSAEMLESLAKLWITLAYRQGIGPNFAFKLLHK